MTARNGNETEGGTHSKRVKSDVAETTCPFCSFVLAVYPELRGMNWQDEVTFREHLTKVHGLRQEITE